MKLPVTTNILGDSITIREGNLKDKMGEWNEKTGTITIKDGLHKFGKHVILMHEILHVCENIMIDNKIINDRVDHEFISSISFGICALLAEAGALQDITHDDVVDFIKEQEAHDEPEII